MIRMSYDLLSIFILRMPASMAHLKFGSVPTRLKTDRRILRQRLAEARATARKRGALWVCGLFDGLDRLDYCFPFFVNSTHNLDFLVGGLEHFLFSIIYGIILPID